VITLHDRDTITLFLPSQPQPRTSSQNGSGLADACAAPASQAGPESVLTSGPCARLFFSITADPPARKEPNSVIEDPEALIEKTRSRHEAREAEPPSFKSSDNPGSVECEPSHEGSQLLIQETQFVGENEGADRPVYGNALHSQISSSFCSDGGISVIDDDRCAISVMQKERSPSEELLEGPQTCDSISVMEKDTTRSDDTERTKKYTSEELEESASVLAQKDLKLYIAKNAQCSPRADETDRAHEASANDEPIDPEAQLDHVPTNLGPIPNKSVSEPDDDEELPDLNNMITSSARRVREEAITPQATDQRIKNGDATAHNEHDEHDPADYGSTPSDKPVEVPDPSINENTVKKKSRAKRKAKGKADVLNISAEQDDPPTDEVDLVTKPKQELAKAKVLPTKKRHSTGSLKAIQDDDDTETCDSLFNDPEDLSQRKRRRSAGSAGDGADSVPATTPVVKKAAPKQKKAPKTPARKASKSATATPSTAATIKKVAFSYSTTVDRPAILKKFFDLGYKKAEHVSPQCDMLVVGAGALQKTIKLLIAVARGTTIVTDDFITRSAEDGKLPAVSAYLPGGISDIGVSRESLFIGKDLYITPALREVYKFEYLNIVELSKIIGFKSTTSKVARGVVTTTNTIVLGFGVNDPDAMTLHEEGAICYTKDFLSASILRNEVDLDGVEFRNFKARSSQTPAKTRVSQSVTKSKGAQKDKIRTKSM